MDLSSLLCTIEIFVGATLIGWWVWVHFTDPDKIHRVWGGRYDVRLSISQFCALPASLSILIGIYMMPMQGVSMPTLAFLAVIGLGLAMLSLAFEKTHKRRSLARVLLLAYGVSTSLASVCWTLLHIVF